MSDVTYHPFRPFSFPSCDYCERSTPPSLLRSLPGEFAGKERRCVRCICLVAMERAQDAADGVLWRSAVYGRDDAWRQANLDRLPILLANDA
jgi:hypothetical protein